MRRRTRLPSSRPGRGFRHPARERQPPRPDRVSGGGEDDGRRALRVLGAEGGHRRRREDHVNLEADQFGGELPQPIELPLPRPNLEEDVLAFNIIKLGEPLTKALVAAVDPMEGADVEHAYPRHPPRPLRVGGERRRQESQRDDCPEESDFHGSLTLPSPLTFILSPAGRGWGEGRGNHSTTLMATDPRRVNRARIVSPALGRRILEMDPEITTSPGFSARPRVSRWLASQARAFSGLPITSAAVWVPTISPLCSYTTPSSARSRLRSGVRGLPSTMALAWTLLAMKSAAVGFPVYRKSGSSSAARAPSTAVSAVSAVTPGPTSFVRILKATSTSTPRPAKPLNGTSAPLAY